jgi:mevalonate kinase
MVDLIFDRTNEDVARLKTLRTKVRNRTATVKEYEEWLTSLKGAYNNTDLNRVGEAINYLGNLLNTYGYINDATAKTDWEIGDKPNPKQMVDYLNNLNKLKECYAVYSSTPSLPSDMDKLVVSEANNIEKFLYDIDELIQKMEAIFRYSNTFYSGESEGLN